jgi:AcrR family transcriptional regulator
MPEPIKQRLLQATEACLRQSGADGLKARQIAAVADCAVGSIYKAFSNLEAAADLVIADVFDRLRASLIGVAPIPNAPQAHADALAAAYLAFARAEGKLWLAIFELPAQAGTPEGVTRQKALERVFEEAHAAVGAIVPEQQAETVTQMLWAGLHGLSHLEATGTLADGDPSAIDALAVRLVEAILANEAPTKGNGR